MAAAFLNGLCGSAFEAHSASVEPGEPSSDVVQAMRESGLDISGKETTAASGAFKSGQSFDLVITLCDEIKSQCDPIVPATSARLHWSFRDPSEFQGSDEYKLNRTRDVRDSLKAAIEAWCARVCPASAAYEIMFKPFYSQKLNEPAS